MLTRPTGLILFLRRWRWRRRGLDGSRGFRRHAFVHACPLRGRWCRFLGHGLLLSLFKEPAGPLRVPPALLQPRRVKINIGGFRHGQQFSDACFFLRGLLIVFHEVKRRDLLPVNSCPGRGACLHTWPCLFPGIAEYCPTIGCGPSRTLWWSRPVGSSTTRFAFRFPIGRAPSPNIP